MKINPKTHKLLAQAVRAFVEKHPGTDFDTAISAVLWRVSQIQGEVTMEKALQHLNIANMTAYNIHRRNREVQKLIQVKQFIRNQLPPNYRQEKMIQIILRQLGMLGITTIQEAAAVLKELIPTEIARHELQFA